MSGIIRLSAQSPPPITLPARSDANEISKSLSFEFLKNESLNDDVISSAHP